MHRRRGPPMVFWRARIFGERNKRAPDRSEAGALALSLKCEIGSEVEDECVQGRSGASSSELFRLVRVVWPILSWVLMAMIGPGLLIGQIEGWHIDEAFYFTFVTGLTIGYGDLSPRHVVSRLLAVVIGFAGIVLTGLVVAL